MGPMTLKEKFRLWLIQKPGKIVIWLWMKACRWTIVGGGPYEALRKAGRPVVLLVWHGKIFVVPFFFRRCGIMPLVSPSKDGEFVARLIMMKPAHVGLPRHEMRFRASLIERVARLGHLDLFKAIGQEDGDLFSFKLSGH
jgi:hypothetical protein